MLPQRRVEEMVVVVVLGFVFALWLIGWALLVPKDEPFTWRVPCPEDVQCLGRGQ